MRKGILVGVALAIGAFGVTAAPAGASTGSGGSFHCNKTINGGTLNSNVVVTSNGVCILNGVTVNGNVSVNTNAYFESNASTIAGNVTGGGALTIYIRNHSNVAGNVAGYLTAQVFVYNSWVGKNVAAVTANAPGYGHFQVCGSTVERTVGAALVGPDVLIGDPAARCGANTVNAGNIEVVYNATNREAYVIGNNVLQGGIGIYGNSGVGDKRVNGNNAPNGQLFCQDNSKPFNGAGNGTVGAIGGDQCTAATLTGNFSSP